MSACPNWRELLSSRIDSRAPEPEGLADALVHFDGCAVCRREACRIDPTLVFRRLPVAALDFDLEAEQMRLAVAGMRASERVEGRTATISIRPLSIRLRGQSVRWALAAGLAGAALLLGGRGDLADAKDPGAGPRIAASLGPADGAVSARFDPVRPPVAIESAVEDLGRPDARIYQFDGERLSVVMIVDEKLDV